MAERLTKEYYYTWDENGTKKLSYIQKLQNKLGKLEDILEKYGIGIDELENIIINGLAMIDIQKINVFKEMELKAERDTWKRACELACRHIAEVEWFSCPETDSINKSEDEIKTLAKQSLNYFYQQVKKEGNDE